jgi:hypothetical protein
MIRDLIAAGPVRAGIAARVGAVPSADWPGRGPAGLISIVMRTGAADQGLISAVLPT